MKVLKSAFFPISLLFVSKQKVSGYSKSMCLAMEMMASKGKVVTGGVMVWIEKGWIECTKFFEISENLKIIIGRKIDFIWWRPGFPLPIFSRDLFK